METISKEDVILQLANMATGIERCTGDSEKARVLRSAIAHLDPKPSDSNQERYNLHGCGSANEIIKELKAERDNYAAHIERIANVVLSDRFPDEVAQNQLLFLVKRRAPKTGLLELKRETAYNAIMWLVSELELSKPEQDIVSAMAVEYINDKWPLDDSGKAGES